MTDDRDTGLLALFDAAPRAAASDGFVARVAADIDRQRQKAVAGWIAAAVLLAFVAWWFTGPVVATMSLVAQLVPDSLVELESDWLAQLLAPVNSATGVAGLLFLAGWAFYRRVLR